MPVKKIYAVDDYPLAAYTIKRSIETFSKNECIVSDFEDPLILLANFKKEFETVDLVITDYEMPSLRGDELIRKLREIKPEIKIIVVSAWLDSSKEEDRHIVEKEVKILKPEMILSKPFPKKWVDKFDEILSAETTHA
ncbi:response regulator [bacterium]|nr:response regulator [bacterium]MBU1959367.1 response regulator [bacterium]